jgi:hypothetical protein
MPDDFGSGGRRAAGRSQPAGLPAIGLAAIDAAAIGASHPSEWSGS